MQRVRIAYCDLPQEDRVNVLIDGGDKELLRVVPAVDIQDTRRIKTDVPDAPFNASRIGKVFALIFHNITFACRLLSFSRN